jgi:hypothetical protein
MMSSAKNAGSLHGCPFCELRASSRITETQVDALIWIILSAGVVLIQNDGEAWWHSCLRSHALTSSQGSLRRFDLDQCTRPKL